MSEKLLWSTVVVKVPSEFITVDAKGKIKICPPLTKRGALAKKNGKTAINIVASDGNKVEIENGGEYKSAPERKVRQKRALTEEQIRRNKANREMIKAHKAQHKQQEQERERNENEGMGNEDINRAETMAEKMARLRAMRKKKKKAESKKRKKVQLKEQEKERNENEGMGNEDINRAESMAEKMARLRAMRKNVTIRKKDKHKFKDEDE